MIINFPKLEPWQQDVYDCMENCCGTGKVFVVKSRRQIGKSILCSVKLIETCLIKPSSVSIMIEPTLTQCRRVYNDIVKWLKNTSLIENFNNSLLEIKFKNGSEIVFKSAEQRDRLRGYTVTGILILDESAFISDDIIQICLPFCDANNAPLLMVSTPMFKDGLFYKFFSEADNKTSFSFDWSTYDVSKYISPEKLKFYQNTMTESKFKTEMLGLFLEDGGYVFKNILNCIKPQSSKPPIYGGLDWAIGNGGDYTVLCLMDEDQNIVDIYFWNDIEPTQQLAKLASIINSYHSLKYINAEQNSIGAVYISQLKKLLNKPSIIKSFITSNDSKKRIIENLATDFVNENIGILDIPELITQLQHYAMEKTKSGYTYNGVTGFHDDFCMALGMCNDFFHQQNGSYNISLLNKHHF